MTDLYRTQSPSLMSPLIGGFPVTPSNDTDLPSVTREVFAVAGGTINAVWQDGSTFAATIGAGERVPWRLARILATGTTATGIEGFY